MNEVHKIYKQSMSSAGFKCLFTPTILGFTRKAGQTYLVFGDISSRSVQYACKITSRCVQWLRFVPRWLTYRHTDT